VDFECVREYVSGFKVRVSFGSFSSRNFIIGKIQTRGSAYFKKFGQKRLHFLRVCRGPSQYFSRSTLFRADLLTLTVESVRERCNATLDCRSGRSSPQRSIQNL
jgi:hypothetical protein